MIENLSPEVQETIRRAKITSLEAARAAGIPDVALDLIERMLPSTPAEIEERANPTRYQPTPDVPAEEADPQARRRGRRGPAPGTAGNGPQAAAALIRRGSDLIHRGAEILERSATPDEAQLRAGLPA
jgi:hypothetical protein